MTLLGRGDNTLLDALATATAVMAPDGALAMLDALPVAYVIIYADKRRKVSGNLERFARDLRWVEKAAAVPHTPQ